MQATAAMQTVTPIARSPISASRPMLRDVGRGAPCSMCRLKEHCIPRGLDADEMPVLEQLVTRRCMLETLIDAFTEVEHHQAMKIVLTP